MDRGRRAVHGASSVLSKYHERQRDVRLRCGIAEKDEEMLLRSTWCSGGSGRILTLTASLMSSHSATVESMRMPSA